MSLEKRVEAIEQKLGISPSPSAVTAPVEAASTNTAPVEAAIPTVTAPINATPTNTSPAMLPSTNTSTVPDTTTISLNEYNGTIKDLFGKIQSKITDLNSPSNKGKYINRVAELRNLLGNLKKATTVQDIQSTIGLKLKFKNNNLMGGKTKRRGRKTKKSNKSKRR